MYGLLPNFFPKLCQALHAKVSCRIQIPVALMPVYAVVLVCFSVNIFYCAAAFRADGADGAGTDLNGQDSFPPGFVADKITDSDAQINWTPFPASLHDIFAVFFRVFRKNNECGIVFCCKLHDSGTDLVCIGVCQIFKPIPVFPAHICHSAAS